MHIRVPKEKVPRKNWWSLRWKMPVWFSQRTERGLKREEGRTIGAVHEVEEWLGLKNVVRMEAYDISNISGFESVGSMVVLRKRPSEAQ